MAIKSIRKMALRKLQAAMMSETAMKLMADPRVQNVMFKAFQVQHTAKTQVDGAVAGFAKRFNLVTKKDLTALNRRIRELESNLANLRNPK